MDDWSDITDEQLRKLAGDDAFLLGRELFVGERVEIVSSDGDRVEADVDTGEGCYRVTLARSGLHLDGACNCAASEGIDFCCHCVATALTLRGEQTMACLGGEPEDVLSAYLSSMSHSTLVEHLSTIILDEKTLRESWLLKAEIDLGVMDRRSIRKRITIAIPHHGKVHRSVDRQRYYRQVEAALIELIPPIQKLVPEEQLDILDYAVSRLIVAHSEITDYCDNLPELQLLLQQSYQTAFEWLNCPDDGRAERLLQWLVDDREPWCGRIPAAFSRHLSDRCARLFYRKAMAHWRSLPVLRREQQSNRALYERLLAVLEEEVRRSGDHRKLAGLYRKMGQLEEDFLRQAECYIELQQYEKAQHALDRAKQKSRLGESARQRELQQALLMVSEQQEAAVDEVWLQFTQSPTLTRYEYLLQVAANTGAESSWQERTVDWLKTGLTRASDYRYHQLFNTLLSVYLAKPDLELAWGLVEKGAVDHSTWFELRKHFRGDRDRSEKIYRILVEHCLDEGDEPNAREAAQLIGEFAGFNRDSATRLLDSVHGRFADWPELLARLNGLSQNGGG